MLPAQATTGSLAAPPVDFGRLGLEKVEEEFEDPVGAAGEVPLAAVEPVGMDREVTGVAVPPEVVETDEPPDVDEPDEPTVNCWD